MRKPKLVGIAKPKKPSNKGLKTIDRLIKKGVKKAKKQRQKKVKALERNAQSWEKARIRALNFVQEMEDEGYFIDNDTLRMLNAHAPERMTKKKLDEMRKKVTKTQLKQRAMWGIQTWQKKVYENEVYIDPKTGKEETLTVTRSGSSREPGMLDVLVRSEMSYKLMEQIGKDPDKSRKELANVLNGLIGYQRNNYMSTEAPLTQKVWLIAMDLNGGQIPDPNKANEYFKIAKEYEEQHTTQPSLMKSYKGLYDMVMREKKAGKVVDERIMQELRFAFFRSVTFKKLPGTQIFNVQDIAEHPQTSEELYEQYQTSSSLRKYKSHYNKLVDELASQNQLPVGVAGKLLYVMELSQSWNIAGQEDLQSDQFTENWRHMYYDLSQLDNVPLTDKNERKLDRLARKIINESITIDQISAEVEKILRDNGKTYRSLGTTYTVPKGSKRKKRK